MEKSKEGAHIEQGRRRIKACAAAVCEYLTSFPLQSENKRCCSLSWQPLYFIHSCVPAGYGGCHPQTSTRTHTHGHAHFLPHGLQIAARSRPVSVLRCQRDLCRSRLTSPSLWGHRAETVAQELWWSLNSQPGSK